jgi:hypothetical protein
MTLDLLSILAKHNCLSEAVCCLPSSCGRAVGPGVGRTDHSSGPILTAGPVIPATTLLCVPGRQDRVLLFVLIRTPQVVTGERRPGAQPASGGLVEMRVQGETQAGSPCEFWSYEKARGGGFAAPLKNETKPLSERSCFQPLVSPSIRFS